MHAYLAGVVVKMAVSRMGMNAHANHSAPAQALSVRPLPQRCQHLQPLRPRSALLQRSLFSLGQPEVAPNVQRLTTKAAAKAVTPTPSTKPNGGLANK